MNEPRYPKLVRDRIPEIVRALGLRPIVSRVEGVAYEAALQEKIIEELDELRVATPEERLDELADLYEVLSALARFYGYPLEHVAAQAGRKRAERGGFEAQLVAELPGEDAADPGSGVTASRR